MLGARRTLDELGRQHIDILNENALATSRWAGELSTTWSGPYPIKSPSSLNPLTTGRFWPALAEGWPVGTKIAAISRLFDGV